MVAVCFHFLSQGSSKETTLRPPKAMSELSVSVSGIYLLGNKMNLSEVLGVKAAPGRQFLP